MRGLVVAGAALAAAAAGSAITYIVMKSRTRQRTWHSTHTLSEGTRVTIRSANEADAGCLFRLTYNLAEICNEVHALIETEEGMRAALRASMFEALVVELPGSRQVIAMAIFQASYRTWSGNSLYLQDLIVDVALRGKGIGTLLFRVLSQIALARQCDRLFWETTSDNSSAQAFYSGPTIGAKHADELLTFKLIGREKLAALAHGS